jgi:hypothetical protein
MDYSPRDEAGNLRRFECKFLGNDAGHATYALRSQDDQDDGWTAWLNIGTGSSGSPHTTTYLVGDERFSPIATWLVQHLPKEHLSRDRARDRVVIHVKQPVDPWTTQASWAAKQQHGTVQDLGEYVLVEAATSILTDSSDSGLTESQLPWDDFHHLFTSQMMPDLGSTGINLTSTTGPSPGPPESGEAETEGRPKKRRKARPQLSCDGQSHPVLLRSQ